MAAVAVGADGVELDVRRTADGGLACAHDEHLDDGSAIVGLPVAALPAEVPTLAVALDLCRPLALVNVEIKNLPGEGDFDPGEQVAEDVVALLEARGDVDGGRILVSSFHRPTIDRVRALAPGLATGWLLLDAREPGLLVEQAAALGHGAIHPHHAFVNEALVELAHGAGVAVNTWTVDDADRQRWLADVGVDAIITNDPASALRALGR
jgi:glycerophosphoryl diester phosphodiesterase